MITAILLILVLSIGVNFIVKYILLGEAYGILFGFIPFWYLAAMAITFLVLALAMLRSLDPVSPTGDHNGDHLT